MQLTAGEKIKIILKRRGMTTNDLAEKTNQSQQNIANKFRRDNFQESELRVIAEALNCTFQTDFIFNDTGEKI
jgi:transcriptional regulator with XRE-family HTH domain